MEYKCWQCNDLGTVSAECSEGYEFAFACQECNIGRQQPKLIRAWNASRLVSGYKLLTMWWHNNESRKEGA